MEPYVIRQGDTLARVAYKFGFDADSVWNEAQNADLSKLRSDPNILWPTDILYIPDQGNTTPDYETLATGTTNSFVSDVPTLPLCIQFVDTQLASQPCTIDELEHLAGLSTDGSGLLKFDAPVTLGVATITFAEVPFRCSLRIGQLDPLNTLSGVYQRLRNLGYIDERNDPCNLDIVRSALVALKQDKAPPSDDAPPDSSAESDSAAPSSDATPDGAGDDPSSDAVSDSGMSDDGTMDDETSKVLFAAHGC